MGETSRQRELWEEERRSHQLDKAEIGYTEVEVKATSHAAAAARRLIEMG